MVARESWEATQRAPDCSCSTELLVPQNISLCRSWSTSSYTDLGVTICIGDPSQPRPPSLSKRQCNVFRDHLELIPMKILVRCEFDMHFFTTQDWILPYIHIYIHTYILAVVNSTIYDKKLENAPELKSGATPTEDLSEQLEEFKKDKFNTKSPLVYLDYG